MRINEICVKYLIVVVSAVSFILVSSSSSSSIGSFRFSCRSFFDLVYRRVINY